MTVSIAKRFSLRNGIMFVAIYCLIQYLGISGKIDSSIWGFANLIIAFPVSICAVPIAIFANHFFGVDQYLRIAGKEIDKAQIFNFVTNLVIGFGWWVAISMVYFKGRK